MLLDRHTTRFLPALSLFLVCAITAYAGDPFSDATSLMGEVGGPLVKFIKTLSGLFALFFLIEAIYKAYKGENDAAGRLIWVIVGLVFFYVAIEVLSSALGFLK